jgi:hypothetical protein
MIDPSKKKIVVADQTNYYGVVVPEDPGEPFLIVGSLCVQTSSDNCEVLIGFGAN